jgi:hypothetical protein
LAPTANGPRDEAVDVRAASTDQWGVQADVVGARTQRDAALNPPRPSERPGGASILISIDIPGRSEELGLELHPSRIAAAWLIWLAVTFGVIAFWLPAPARRLRRERPARRRR